MPKKYCVIGGVAAGMSSASQIKRRMPDATVTVLEKGHDVSYGACGMPYNIADPGREVDDLLVIKAKDFINKRGLDLRVGHEAKKIDRENKKVIGLTDKNEEFSVDYDVLVLATGSRAVNPPVPGIDSKGIFNLRILQDAHAIKAHLAENKCKEAIVIGGSYLGIEMAEAMKQRGLTTTIIKRSPVMLGSLPQDLDEMVKKELDSHDIKVIHGKKIERIEQGERLKLIMEDEELQADIIISAAGFAPRSELAKEAGLELGPKNSIAVDEYGKTSDENIFAIGDCSDNFHLMTGKKVWIPLALHANRGGRLVGATVCGDPQIIPPVLGTTAVRAFDLEVASTGLSAAEAKNEGLKPVSATIRSRSRAHAFPGASMIWVHLVAQEQDGKLLGGAIVGGDSAAVRINTIAAAIHGKMTIHEFSEMDLMYSPPFSPAWDPVLVCANQLVKKAGKII